MPLGPEIQEPFKKKEWLIYSESCYSTFANAGKFEDAAEQNSDGKASSTKGKLGNFTTF